jgi:hypothetical protein
MQLWRKLFGWLVALIGCLGMLACLAAVIGVWILSHRVRGSVERVVGKVTEFTLRVEERSGEVAVRIGESRGKVQGLERRLEEKVSALAEGGGLDPAEVQDLEDQLRGLAQRIHDWMEVAESTREFMELFGEILDSLGGVVGAEGQEELGAELTSGLGEVREAAGVLDELVVALDEAGTNREAADGGEKIEPILPRFANSLAVLEKRTTDFSSKVGSIGTAAETFGKTINRRVFLGAIVATVLLAWQAAAQWCLARWGRGLCRMTKAPMTQ